MNYYPVNNKQFAILFTLIISLAVTKVVHAQAVEASCPSPASMDFPEELLEQKIKLDANSKDVQYLSSCPSSIESISLKVQEESLFLIKQYQEEVEAQFGAVYLYDTKGNLFGTYTTSFEYDEIGRLLKVDVEMNADMALLVGAEEEYYLKLELPDFFSIENTREEDKLSSVPVKKNEVMFRLSINKSGEFHLFSKPIFLLLFTFPMLTFRFLRRRYPLIGFVYKGRKQLKKKVKQLISSGELGKAFEAARFFIGHEKHDDFIILKSWYQRIVSENQCGVLEKKYADVQLNKITKALLELAA